MPSFMPLLTRANIELADLAPAIELNGLLIYLGEFPHGGGRLLLHPSLGNYDSPAAAAVIAHELAHILLSHCSDHPATVRDLYDAARRRHYRRHEAEADCLAAHLLVPSDIRAAYPSPRFPTPDSLAQALAVPVRVVRRALLTRAYDPRPAQTLLWRLTGQPDFIPRPQALAA